jgi:hypothetical protein
MSKRFGGCEKPTVNIWKWINNNACRLKQKYLDKITPDVSGV